MIELNRLKISNKMIVEGAEARGWQVEVIDYEEQILKLIVPDVGSALISFTNSKYVSAIGRTIATNKNLTSILTAEAEIPTPETICTSDFEEILSFSNKYPKVVIKPLDGAHGNGVTVDIDSEEKLREAYKNASSISDRVLAQQQVYGGDVRILFIGDTYVGSITRKPASVIGDGKKTVMQLIKEENINPNRGADYEKDLNFIDIEAATAYLGDSIDNIPNAKEEVRVMGGANVGLGGTSTEISNTINPTIINGAKKIKDACLLTHAGIDLMVKDFSQPPSKENPVYLIEANGGPLLAFHQKPNFGEGKPAIDIYLDWIEDQIKKERS